MRLEEGSLVRLWTNRSGGPVSRTVRVNPLPGITVFPITLVFTTSLNRPTKPEKNNPQQEISPFGESVHFSVPDGGAIFARYQRQADARGKPKESLPTVTRVIVDTSL